MSISKKRVEWLIETFSPYFICRLHLNKKNIRFYSVHHESVAGKSNKASEDILGHSLLALGKTEIYIYYNNHFSEKQCIGTILHELLHFKFHCLNKAKGKHDGVEEEIIKSFEKLYLDNFQNKILTIYLN